MRVNAKEIRKLPYSVFVIFLLLIDAYNVDFEQYLEGCDNEFEEQEIYDWIIKETVKGNHSIIKNTNYWSSSMRRIYQQKGNLLV